MRSQSNPYCLILSAFGFFSLLFLSSCTQSDSGDTTTDIAIQPVPIGGKNIANFDNARISCGFTGEAGRYRVDCRLTAIDSSGSERTVDGVVPGLEINWQDPKLLSGPELRGLSCEVASSQLSQSCEVILDASQMAKLQFSNLIRETLSQRSREESEIVTLPLEITTYGLTPEMGRRVLEAPVGSAAGVEKLGFQTVAIPANSQNFSIDSLCLQGDDIYFVSGITIFRAQKNAVTGEYSVTLWAGSTSVSNVNNLSHRLRVYMGVVNREFFGGQNPLRIACGKDFLVVGDPNNERILRIRPQGSVEKISGFGNDVLEEGAVAENVSLRSDSLMGKVFITASGEVHFEHRGRLYRIRSGKIQRIACTDGALSVPTVGTLVKDLGCSIRERFGLGEDGRIYMLADMGSFNEGLIIYFIAADSNGVIEEVRTLPEGTSIDRLDAVGDRALLFDRYQIFSFIGGELQVLAGVKGLSGNVSEGNYSTPQPFSFTMALESKGKLWISTLEQIISVTPNMLASFRLDVLVGLKAITPRIYPKEVSAGTAILPRIDTISLSPDGSVYYLDELYSSVGRISSDHLVKTVVGTGQTPVLNNESGRPATETDFHSLQNMVLAPNGDLWLFESVPLVGVRTRIVSHETQLVSSSDNTLFGDVMKFGPDGKLYASDFGRLRRMDPATGNIEVIVDENTMIPLASGEEREAGWIRGFTFGDAEEIFFSEARYGRVCRTYLDEEGVRQFETIAGNGTIGYSGDGGLALNAQLHFPKSLDRDKRGNIFMIGGDFVRRSESRLRVLRPTAQGYTIETLFGGNLAESADCGSGAIKKDVGAGEVNSSLKTTLGSVCPGLMFDVNVRDRCEAEGRKTLVFAQRFASGSTQSTLVRVEQPCE